MRRQTVPPLPAPASKPGDTIRQGRVAREIAPRSAPSGLEFVTRGIRVVAKLGVIEVGEIMPNPAARAGSEYLWACFLRPCAATPRPAGCEGKARAALDYQVRQWLEAACLVPSAALALKLTKDRGGK